MINMEEKQLYGIIGILTILAGFGGYQYLTIDQIDNAYVCTTNENVAICTGNPSHPEPLSTTKLTCYYVNENGDNKYSRCTDGFFMDLKTYAKNKGVDIIDILAPSLNNKNIKGSGNGIRSCIVTPKEECVLK